MNKLFQKTGPRDLDMYISRYIFNVDAGYLVSMNIFNLEMPSKILLTDNKGCEIPKYSTYCATQVWQKMNINPDNKTPKQICIEALKKKGYIYVEQN